MIFPRTTSLITRHKLCIQGRVQNTTPPFINVDNSASTQCWLWQYYQVNYPRYYTHCTYVVFNIPPFFWQKNGAAMAAPVTPVAPALQGLGCSGHQGNGRWCSCRLVLGNAAGGGRGAWSLGQTSFQSGNAQKACWSKKGILTRQQAKIICFNKHHASRFGGKSTQIRQPISNIPTYNTVHFYDPTSLLAHVTIL